MGNYINSVQGWATLGFIVFLNIINVTIIYNYISIIRERNHNCAAAVMGFWKKYVNRAMEHKHDEEMGRAKPCGG